MGPRFTTLCRKGVYLDASSLHSKLRTLGNHVADGAMVDDLGMCLYASSSGMLVPQASCYRIV